MGSLASAETQIAALPAEIATTAELPAASSAPASRAQSGSLAASLVVGVAIGTTLLFARAHATQPVPAFWLAAAFLVGVAQQDAWQRRIPNAWIGAGLAAAIGWNVWVGGPAAGGLALAGIAVPFVLLLAPYAVRAIGAGDVKTFMVLGGLWGIAAVLSVIVWSVIFGGVMAIVYVAAHGELGAWARRWGSMLAAPLHGGGVRYVPPSPDEAAAGGLPMGIAIGVAVAAHLVFGGPWM